MISYEPPNCTVPPAHSVAIIIPFRDNKEQARSHQLFVMLHFMIPILIRQNIKFQFFLITQESFILSGIHERILVSKTNDVGWTTQRLKRDCSIEQNFWILDLIKQAKEKNSIVLCFMMWIWYWKMIKQSITVSMTKKSSGIILGTLTNSNIDFSINIFSAEVSKGLKTLCRKVSEKFSESPLFF